MTGRDWFELIVFGLPLAIGMLCLTVVTVVVGIKLTILLWKEEV